MLQFYTIDFTSDSESPFLVSTDELITVIKYHKRGDEQCRSKTERQVWLGYLLLEWMWEEDVIYVLFWSAERNKEIDLIDWLDFV